jgi:hypothetical protein
MSVHDHAQRHPFRTLSLRLGAGDLRDVELLAEAHGVGVERYAEFLLLHALRLQLRVTDATQEG